MRFFLLISIVKWLYIINYFLSFVKLLKMKILSKYIEIKVKICTDIFDYIYK